MEIATAVKRVLVVDDNEDTALLAAEILRYRGHSVEVATSGREGLAAAISTLPDVVLLDLGMPGMDGYEVAVALRAGASTRKARLIALTAWGDSETRARVIDCGFDCHLVKPADCAALFEAVEATPP